MRIQTLFIIGAILLFSGMSFAQTTATTTSAADVAVSTTAYCRPVDALEETARECREAGRSFYFTQSTNADGTACRDIVCQDPSVCPTMDMIERQINHCIVDEKVSYTKYVDEKGCTQVRCVATPHPVNTVPPQATVTCKKTVSDQGCVEVFCNDGYRFNSCNDAGTCKVQSLECKSYTDADGCYVRSCSNGLTNRSCPDKQEVKCEVETLDDGCFIKTCSDGTKATSCPQQNVVCKNTVDEDGCTVTSCDNGRYSRVCPDTAQDKEVKCEVFVREDGHTIKECDNGFRVDYSMLKDFCAQTGVDYTGFDNPPLKCIYGPNSEYTLTLENGAQVECVINFENQTQYCTTGAVLKSAGTSAPASDGDMVDSTPTPGRTTTTDQTPNDNESSPTPTTNTGTGANASSNGPFDGLARFIASIFGQNN